MRDHVISDMKSSHFFCKKMYRFTLLAKLNTLIPSFSMMINTKYVGSLALLLEEKEISKTGLEADLTVFPM